MMKTSERGSAAAMQGQKGTIGITSKADRKPHGKYKPINH
jgi:hypothetical protein